MFFEKSESLVFPIAINSLKDSATFAVGIASDMKAAFAAKGWTRLLVFLDGPMGVGKTRFVCDFAHALGAGEMASPSFAIHHSYRGDNYDIEHFDLFRLESEDDLESTGFWDCFRKREGIVIVEWAARLQVFGAIDQIPNSWPLLKLKFSFLGPVSESDERRCIEIEV